MTKFEEEFKALSSWDWVNVDLIQQILTRFGNWHSDEEFQELKEEYSNQADSILLMLEEIGSLKSQLQQQALPVVPECVDLLIKVCKEMNFDVRNAFSVGPDEIDNIEDECFVWMRNNSNEFALAFITGKYTVEKSDKCMVKLGALYFKCWNDVDAVFIIDDQPGAYESAFVFKKREDAEKVAKLVGGRVVKN